MALVAAAAAPAAAADYEFYITTNAESAASGATSGYELVQEGKEYVANPEMEGIQLECAAFIKVVNNTSSDAQCLVSVTKVYDNNDFAGLTPLWQTCLGFVCQTGDVTATVNANSSTPGGIGEHIGYTVYCLDPSAAENVKFDSKYNVTMKMGDTTRSFSILYTSTPAAVETIDVAGGQAEYFNMPGLRVSEPVKGQMYIVRQGGKVSKTVVR